MQNLTYDSTRRFLRASCLFFIACGGLVAAGNSAQAIDAIGMTPVVIHNDRGGRLETRLRQLSSLRQSGQPVEIRGSVCFSTCTLLLGLPQTCILPRTVFGFHGPSSYGRALDPTVFERASVLIANHYPAALRRWYLDTGRYRIRTMYRIRGAQLLKVGAKSC